MIKDVQKDFLEKFPLGKINENLARLSTFQIGGPADFFYHLENTERLEDLLSFCKKNEIDVLPIGTGSNIFFHDKGFRGLILKVDLRDLKLEDDLIVAGAGVLIPKLIKFSIEEGFEGLEPWMGLPGTVGGAVRGNAGCNGLETQDILVSAKLLNLESGKIHEENLDFFNYSYRESSIKDNSELVLEARFRLKKREMSEEEQQKMVNHYRVLRATKQPFGLTTGSFFKNPSSEKAAGYLIDQCGLKGKSIGKAQISEKHANFFLNKGGATYEEMLNLVTLAQDKVYEKFKIELEPEVFMVPEKLEA